MWVPLHLESTAVLVLKSTLLGDMSELKPHDIVGTGKCDAPLVFVGALVVGAARGNSSESQFTQIRKAAEVF